MKKTIAVIMLCLCLLTGCRRETLAETTKPLNPAPVMTMPAEVFPEETAIVPETTAAETAAWTEPAEEDMVKISDYIPTAQYELFYATDRNFTGQVIYDFEEPYLRYGTVKKLMAVSRDLEELGLQLKIWDGFRPVSAQFKLWEVYPDPTYVANPNVGYSSHSRGNTVDLTLVDETGTELKMPTAFDDFSQKADRNYSDCTQIEEDNARILELLMEKHGFSGYFGEWWHYSDTVSYPVETEFEPSQAG